MKAHLGPRRVACRGRAEKKYPGVFGDLQICQIFWSDSHYLRHFAGYLFLGGRPQSDLFSNFQNMAHTFNCSNIHPFPQPIMGRWHLINPKKHHFHPQSIRNFTPSAVFASCATAALPSGNCNKPKMPPSTSAMGSHITGSRLEITRFDWKLFGDPHKMRHKKRSRRHKMMFCGP